MAIAGMTLATGPIPLARAVSPNTKLNIAGVGVGGKGWEDINSSTGEGKLHNVVAICDPDQRSRKKHPGNLGTAQLARPIGLGGAAEKFPKAARFADFRRMFDKEHKNIDAVTVSTPDHMHAPASLMAMRLGKHVYTQKPLTYTVQESRVMRRVAAETGVITQMGNQHHASKGYRCLVQVLQSGVIGKVKEAHAWVKSPIWPQGMDNPRKTDPVPDGMHWDTWLGVAPVRPFKEDAYAPFNWRGWLDFGTGALGDMGCHVLDPIVWSLGLGPARTVKSYGSPPNGASYPHWTTVRYSFDGTAYTDGPIGVTWYDGGRQPDVALAQMPKGRSLPDGGTMYIGEKGVVVIPHRPSIPRVYPEAKFMDYMRNTLKDLYASTPPLDHYRQWTDACLGDGEAATHFGYSGPLCETVQLGNIALRFPGRELTWDSEAFRFVGNTEADKFIAREYRKGWEVEGLG
jgi:predicted dehydrogenase